MKPQAVLELSEKDIIEAIGKNKKFKEEWKSKFAEALLERINNILQVREIGYPDTELVKTFIKDMRTVQKIANKWKDNEEKPPFISTLESVAIRKIVSKNYSELDFEDIEVFTRILADFAGHERFRKNKTGPDSRLPIDLAFAMADLYERHFGEKPGISGQKTKYNKNYELIPNDTPYQRVCALLCLRLGMRIGRKSQKKAIQELTKLEPHTPHFDPDVHNLSEKKLIKHA